MSKTYTFGSLGKSDDKDQPKFNWGIHTIEPVKNDLYEYQKELYRQIDASIVDSYKYNYNKTWIVDEYEYYKKPPKPTKTRVESTIQTIEILDEEGSLQSISREDLLKYISERKVIESNEVVRAMYERYQVAVKLVRSDDNGDTGV